MNQLSKLFGALSVLLLLTAAVLAFSLRDGSPVIVGNLDEADRQTERFMEALCSGDFHTVETLLDSGAVLTPEQAFSTPLTETLWNAYIDTLNYQFHGSCYADDYGLYREVTVAVLDLPTLMSDLQSSPLMMHTATDSAQITDALTKTAADLIARGTYTADCTITLHLTGRSGRWQVQPTPQLIALIQGSMGGA